MFEHFQGPYNETPSKSGFNQERNFLNLDKTNTDEINNTSLNSHKMSNININNNIWKYNYKNENLKY